jgi:cell division inhibitor SepF
MQHDHSEAEEYDDSPRRARGNGLISWVKDAFARPRPEDDDLYDDEEEPIREAVAHVAQPTRATGGSTTPIRRTGSTLRLESARRGRVAVRHVVQSFEDVRKAVDGLREGVQQIINMEQTPPDKAERLIDFLNGATYAIDGYVEKIGEHVFLFTPPTVVIDVEERAASATKPSFFDRA